MNSWTIKALKDYSSLTEGRCRASLLAGAKNRFVRRYIILAITQEESRPLSMCKVSDLEAALTCFVDEWSCEADRDAQLARYIEGLTLPTEVKGELATRWLDGAKSRNHKAEILAKARALLKDRLSQRGQSLTAKQIKQGRRNARLQPAAFIMLSELDSRK